MASPSVDVIIPVHTDRRPIARAVSSVLDSATASVRVNVVCHNTPEASIAAALGPWVRDDRVRLLHHEDGIASPAGPINAGYRAATGEFTCLLDSDDEYEAHAIDSWLTVQRRANADVVIAPLRHANGSSPRTPPTRPGRSHFLDGVRDRLAYRTRQHGLVRREAFPALSMTPGLRTGEDVIQGLAIWYSGARISFARRGPAYIIHSDSDERASVTSKPASESLAFVDAILKDPLFEALTTTQRESLAVKFLRTHVMEILAGALHAGTYAEDREAIADAVARLFNASPIASKILSRRESHILRGVGKGVDSAVLQTEIGVVTDFRRPASVLPASLSKVLHREAMPRFLVATAFTR